MIFFLLDTKSRLGRGPYGTRTRVKPKNNLGRPIGRGEVVSRTYATHARRTSTQVRERQRPWESASAHGRAPARVRDRDHPWVRATGGGSIKPPGGWPGTGYVTKTTLLPACTHPMARAILVPKHPPTCLLVGLLGGRRCGHRLRGDRGTDSQRPAQALAQTRAGSRTSPRRRQLPDLWRGSGLRAQHETEQRGA